MERDREKKTIRQHFLDWWLPVLALVLVVGAGRSFVLWQDRNYGQLTTSLITVLGVLVTLWMTQVRAIEQQEREDKRHHARLEAEAKMHDERLRMESEREHKRLASEAQKDRAQRSITQRIDLAEKLASSINHLSSENVFQQAAGVQEILFQIDDWYDLIESEIAEVSEGAGSLEEKRKTLEHESLRRRQELFDIAYKTNVENIDILKSRARGLKSRVGKCGAHSLHGLDLSGVIIGYSDSVELGGNDFQIDLNGIVANGVVMCDAELCRVNLIGAYLEYVNLGFANLRSANLENACLKSANLDNAHLELANLKFADLESANLTFAYLESADLRRACLKAADLSATYLESANLASAYLELANLSVAYLESAYLRHACLKTANLTRARLKSADLSFAKLQGADLSEVDLRCANLRGADLRCANLRGADLRNVDFGSATLWDSQPETGDVHNVSLSWRRLKSGKLLEGSKYDAKTKFPSGFYPEEYGMIQIDGKRGGS